MGGLLQCAVMQLHVLAHPYTFIHVSEVRASFTMVRYNAHAEQKCIRRGIGAILCTYSTVLAFHTRSRWFIILMHPIQLHFPHCSYYGGNVCLFACGKMRIVYVECIWSIGQPTCA